MSGEVKYEAVEGWTITYDDTRGKLVTDKPFPVEPIEVVPKADYDRAIEERDEARAALAEELDWQTAAALARMRELNALVAAKKLRDTPSGQGQQE